MLIMKSCSAPWWLNFYVGAAVGDGIIWKIIWKILPISGKRESCCWYPIVEKESPGTDLSRRNGCIFAKWKKRWDKFFRSQFPDGIGLSGQMVKQKKYRMKNKDPTKEWEVEMEKKKGLTTKVAVLTTKVLQKHYKNTTESLQKHYFDSESTLQYLYKITISSLQCLYKT